MTGQFESAPAERYIAVDSAAMLASFSNSVKVPETIRKIAGLMILNRETLMAHHLLQRYQIGIDLREHPSDAFDANPAVDSAGHTPLPLATAAQAPRQSEAATALQHATADLLERTKTLEQQTALLTEQAALLDLATDAIVVLRLP